MIDATTETRIVPLPQAQDVLTDLLRQGAQQLLAQAIEAEVADWIDRHQDCRDAAGRRQVVRNGHLPQRAITTGVGPVTVQYVYVWADGVYFNIRLEGGRQCLLVLMGATADGKKELIAIQDGQRESEQPWKELLLDVQARGLTIDPKLAIGDGALGFWKAVRQLWPATAEQRCWVHKTANVLDKLPKSVQPK